MLLNNRPIDAPGMKLIVHPTSKYVGNNYIVPIIKSGNLEERIQTCTHNFIAVVPNLGIELMSKTSTTQTYKHIIRIYREPTPSHRIDNTSSHLIYIIYPYCLQRDLVRPDRVSWQLTVLVLWVIIHVTWRMNKVNNSLRWRSSIRYFLPIALTLHPPCETKGL